MEVHIIVKGVIALILKILNIFLHSIGLYLLRHLIKSEGENVQILFIINLSVAELVINIFSFSRNFLKIVAVDVYRSKLSRKIVMFTYFLDYAMLKLCLYMWMLYITVDRVCGVLLTVSYPRYWNIFKSKLLIGITCSLGLAIFISASLVYA